MVASLGGAKTAAAVQGRPASYRETMTGNQTMTLRSISTAKSRG